MAEGEEGDFVASWRDGGRGEGWCSARSLALAELGAWTEVWAFLFFPSCVPARLPEFGILVTTVTGRKESAVLVWGFAGFTPTQAAAG